MEPPGPVAFEYVLNLKDVYPLPSPPYVDLSSRQTRSITIPSGALQPGANYTARIRALVFSETGAATVNGQYFKYTEFGTLNFSVNDTPSVMNLRVNGQPNPTAVSPRDQISLSFTFVDSDGPQYFYDIQIGVVPGANFFPIWDSGLISGGQGYGNQDFTVIYSGPTLFPGITYFWRVDVQDGLVDGRWTDGNDSFKINNLPTVTSLDINGQSILGNPITIPAVGSVMTWVYFDADGPGDPQTAYNLVIAQNGETILNTRNVCSPVSSVALPNIPVGGTVQATLTVMDTHEFGYPITAQFDVSVPPQAVNILIDGKTNPGDVSSSSTPTISWQFLGNNPGSTQVSYDIQVATDDTFETLLWDTGQIVSMSNSVVYGSTLSPIVPPVALVHGTSLAPSGYYYLRISVSDGISPSAYAKAFFSVNAVPYGPLLLLPLLGSYSGSLEIAWTPQISYMGPLIDDDGDSVTYTLEITSQRSSDIGWEYLAGPFPATGGTMTYALDLSTIPEIGRAHV